MKEFFKSLPYAMKKHLLIRSGLSLLFLILFTIVLLVAKDFVNTALTPKCKGANAACSLEEPCP